MGKFKIMVLTFKGSGHINPLLPIIKELVNVNQVETIVYANQEHETSIEKTGAQYRNYIDDEIEWKNLDKHISRGEKPEIILILIRTLINIAFKNMDFIANQIDKEKPDLIVYDFLALYIPLILTYYSTSFQKAKSEKRALPPVIVFNPSPSTNPPVYPNKVEAEFGPQIRISLSFLWYLLRLLVTQITLCFRFGLSFSIIKMTPFKRPDFVQNVITVVLPELQTRAHLFDHKVYKFVGSTVDENYLDPRLLNDELYKNILSQFTLRFNNDHLYLTNDNEINNQGNEKKLVFASLGTVFNNIFKIYKTIVDGFKEFDEEPSKDKNSSLRLNNLTVIVSLGEKMLAQFETLISSKKYELPKNIILVKTAPQLEILKRASLFVTHCGMNSTSESVHFGVPMICIPIFADQPLIAYRVADELGFGIRLNKNTVTSSEIRRAAHKILNDSSYETRIKRFSQISRQTNGAKNASKFLLDVIEKKSS